MNFWINILNVLLIGVAAVAIIRAIRLHAVLQRVQSGLQALRHDRGTRLRQGPEDTESILLEFDSFAEYLQQQARNAIPSSNGQPSHWRNVVAQLSDVLKPSLIAMKSYVALLEHDQAIDPAVRQEYVSKLHTQIDALLLLLEERSTLSELRRGLSGLRREMAEPRPSVLIVDADAQAANRLLDTVPNSVGRVAVPPDADAAGVIAFATHPSLILINAGDARGWSALASLLRVTATDTKIWLYCLADEGGSLLQPLRIQILPGRLSIPKEWSAGVTVSVQGSEPFSQRVADAARTAGLIVEPVDNLHVPLLAECCTIARTANADAKVEYMLIVPAEVLNSEPEKLAASMRESAAFQANVPQMQVKISEGLSVVLPLDG